MKKILLAVMLLVLPTLLSAQTIESYTFTTNRLVPDGDFSGLSDVRTLGSAIGTISSLKVRLKLAGEFNGDLYVLSAPHQWIHRLAEPRRQDRRDPLRLWR